MWFVRSVLAVILGFFIGSLVNITLINIGPMVFPMPAGVDITTMEGLRESMKLFRPVNFLFPFLGHALGTFVGAYIAAKIAVSYKMFFALGIGVFFLFGGITMVVLCGGPLWFIVLDLLVAYIPMGYLGGLLAGGLSAPNLDKPLDVSEKGE